MDRRNFVVLILGIGVKELLLTIISWRAAVVSAVAALSLLSSQTTALQACCGWFDGGWGAGYAPAYTAGYYGSGYGYTSYYAPAYSGGCDPCGPACSSCAPACGGCYAGANCTSCIGGGCNIANPATNNTDQTRPAPDDGFRSVPNDRDRASPADSDAIDNAPPPRRRSTFDEPAEDSSRLPRTRPGRNDGLNNTRGNSGVEPETAPATNNDAFDESEFGPTNSNPRGRSGSNRVPMNEPADGSTTPASPPDDSFDGADDAETKANKPELGKPVPGDSETIIPGRKKPAPTKAEPKEVPLPDEIPKDLDLDTKGTFRGVAPKTRLAISTQIGTPSIVRLKLRPTAKWLADPHREMIARH